jgi:hypothetical protein
VNLRKDHYRSLALYRATLTYCRDNPSCVFGVKSEDTSAETGNGVRVSVPSRLKVPPSSPRSPERLCLRRARTYGYLSRTCPSGARNRPGLKNCRQSRRSPVRNASHDAQLSPPLSDNGVVIGSSARCRSALRCADRRRESTPDRKR